MLKVKDILEKYHLTNIDFLKVGHHGSNTSSSEDFLKQINPTYAVIMAGKNNSYGLPKQKILDRLAKIGAKVYRTDEEGTIMMISNGNNIEVKENTWQFAIIKLKYNR